MGAEDFWKAERERCGCKPAQPMWALCHMDYFAGFTFEHRKNFPINRKLDLLCTLLRNSSQHWLWEKYSIEADIFTCGFLRSSFGAHTYPSIFLHSDNKYTQPGFLILLNIYIFLKLLGLTRVKEPLPLKCLKNKVLSGKWRGVFVTPCSSCWLVSLWNPPGYKHCCLVCASLCTNHLCWGDPIYKTMAAGSISAGLFLTKLLH